MSQECTGGNQPEHCRSDFSEIKHQLERLDKAIRGNGNPGIITRLDRIEQKAQVTSRLFWIVAGSSVPITVGALVAAAVYLIKALA